MGFLRKFSTVAAAFTVMAGIAFSAPSARAGVIQLGFILDSSGSIGAGNWNTIKTGLSSALTSLVPTNSQYEISVVNFSNTANLEVDHVLIDSASTLSTVATIINNMAFIGSTTNMAAAFNVMTTTLQHSSQTIDASYVNLATDGVPYGGANAVIDTIAARNDMVDAGIDNISIEAIGSGVDPGFLQNDICYPGPCDTTSPYNFPTQGFYMAVADANAYTVAIQQKVAIVTNQVPEPGMVAIFGLGILGLAGLRRRLAA